MRTIQEAGFRSSAVSGGETPESGGTALLLSESLLFYSQPPVKNRGQFHKLWRQFLALIVCALFVEAFNKVTLRKYYLRHYFPKEFFHGLVVSLLLGGRAPPRSAY
jgi:hypothetical protein